MNTLLMKTIVKRISKTVIYVALTLFSILSLFIAVMFFSSHARESLLNTVIKKIDSQLLVENLNSPNISTYQFTKLKYNDIELEQGEIVIHLAKLFSKTLYLENVKVDAFSLDFLLTPNEQVNAELDLDYSYLFDFKMPIDIVVESLQVNKLTIDEQTVKVSGSVEWLKETLLPSSRLAISQNKNVLNVVLLPDLNNAYKLNINTNWDQFYGYKNIDQTMRAQIKFVENNIIALDIKQSDLNVDFDVLNINSPFDGHAFIDLNFNNQQRIEMNAKINQSHVSFNVMLDSKNIDGNIQIEKMDMALVQAFIPDNDIAKNSSGEVSATFEIKGALVKPEVHANAEIVALVYNEPVNAKLDIQTDNHIVNVNVDLKSSYVDSQIQSKVNIEEKNMTFQTQSNHFNEKIKAFNFFELDKPFDNTQFKISGLISGDVDYSQDLIVNWQADLNATLAELNELLDVTLKAKGNLDKAQFEQVVIKNTNNSLIGSGHVDFNNWDMTLDIALNLKQLESILWLDEILSDVEIQKKWLIDEYVDIFKQDVYEYQTIFQSKFNGEFEFEMFGDALRLNDFSLDVGNSPNLEFNFTSDVIDLNTMSAERAIGYLDWQSSVLKLKGDIALDDENDFIIDFSQVSSRVVNPIIKFYEFDDYAEFDWQTTGEVSFSKKFENINWNLKSNIDLTKNDKQLALDVVANGDLLQLDIQSLVATNQENTIHVFGKYDIENFVIDVNVDFDVNALFSIPWVSQVWQDEQLQQKWLLKENIDLYKLNVPQSESLLYSKAKGQLDVLYSDEWLKLENMEIVAVSEFYESAIESSVQATLMDINTLDMVGLNIHIKNDLQDISILGDFSYELENQLFVGFSNVTSEFIQPVLQFYEVESINAVDFILSGDFNFDGLYERPNIQLNMKNKMEYAAVPFTVDLDLISSGLLTNPLAKLNVNAESQDEKYPIKVVLNSAYENNVVTVANFKADILESGYLSIDGEYKNNFIESDVFSGFANIHYDYQFDIEKLNHVLIDLFEIEPVFYSIDGDVQSTGSFIGDITQINWLSQIFIDANVVTAIGVEPVHVKVSHDIRTNENIIAHNLMFSLDESNQLAVSGSHQNNIEALMSDPLATNWDAVLKFTGKLNPLIKIIPDVDERIYGNVFMDFSVSNNNAVFESNGMASINNGRYLNEDLGLAVNQFSLNSVLKDNVVSLDVQAKDDSRGAINTKGRFELSKDIIDSVYMEIDFLKAQLVERPDLESKLDGKIFVTGDANQLLVSGDLIAKETSIYLDRMQLVGVPEIVVSQTDQQQNATSMFFETIDLDVNITTDDKTNVSGRGVKMNLTGEANINGNLDDPKIFAQLNLISGQFDLFTRIFEIEKGLVRMENDDVYVEMQAKHVRDSVEYSALISGVEGRYDIQLSSVPVYDQNQLISQLMFGKSVEKINAFQALRLAQAISYLNNNGSQYDILKTTEEMLDVDSIDIQTIDGVMQLLVGKYLNDKVYLQLGTSRSSGQSNVNGLLKIELDENLELKTYSGTNDDNSGVELQWKNDY